MESQVIESQTRPYVLFIDDAWAAPNRSVLANVVSSLRNLLTDHADVRQWFSSEYKIEGDDVRRGDYFDPWLSEAKDDIRFWQRVSAAPRFPEDWGKIADIWNERVKLLDEVRVSLEADGFDVILHKDLPAPDPNNIPPLIILDYILAEHADEKKIAESIQWVAAISDHCRKTPDAQPPLVLLISTALTYNDSDTEAKNFRTESHTLSSYFRLIPKSDPTFKSRVLGFANDHLNVAADELAAFYSVYKGFRDSLEKAISEVLESTERLELEDLITFHAAQLKKEATLDEYLAWLYGQVLTSKLLRHRGLVDAARKVRGSDEAILGQLKAQQLLPELFYEASFLDTAEQVLEQGVAREDVRFANMYRATLHPDTLHPNVVLLAISQTCDLIHNKVTNEQVLCVEGKLSLLEDLNSESALLRMTIEQISRQHQVYKVGNKYYSVDWGDFKNLRTVARRTLNSRSHWQLIGRLNELYALSIQNSAMQELSRIGLPVTPHFVHYIAKISISAIPQGKGRVASRDIGNGDVVAVIRPAPKHKDECEIYLAPHIRKEIAERVTEVIAESNIKGIAKPETFGEVLLNPQVKGFSGGEGDMATGPGIVFRSALLIDEDGTRKKPETLPGFVLVSARSTQGAVERKNSHIEIVFQPI